MECAMSYLATFDELSITGRENTPDSYIALELIRTIMYVPSNKNFSYKVAVDYQPVVHI